MGCNNGSFNERLRILSWHSGVLHSWWYSVLFLWQVGIEWWTGESDALPLARSSGSADPMLSWKALNRCNSPWLFSLFPRKRIFSGRVCLEFGANPPNMWPNHPLDTWCYSHVPLFRANGVGWWSKQGCWQYVWLLASQISIHQISTHTHSVTYCEKTQLLTWDNPGRAGTHWPKEQDHSHGSGA